jgi:hypothetical protein
MLSHDPEKWEPVFGKRSCANKELERDDDSRKNHPALVILKRQVSQIAEFPLMSEPDMEIGFCRTAAVKYPS